MKDTVHRLFDLQDVEAYANFARFRFHLVSLSRHALCAPATADSAAADSSGAAGECTIAIATETHLLLSDNAATMKENGNGSLSSSNRPDAAGGGCSQIVLEFDERFGRPTALEWVSSQVVCVGFESGYFSCYTYDGMTLLEERFDSTPLNAIKLYSFGGEEQCVWLLYESSVLVSVSLSEITDYKIRSLVKIKFVDRAVSSDFAFLPQPFRNSGALLQQGRSSAKSGDPASQASSSSQYSVAVGGCGSALGLYNIGGEVHFQHFGKAVDFYRESLSATVRGGARALVAGLVSFFAPLPHRSNSSEGRPTIDSMGVDEDEGLQMHETAVTAAVDFEDPKRRILRLSAGPCGRLLACADSLGRVLLCDARSFTIVRCWKGVREARLAWSQGSAAEGGAAAVLPLLSLAIYAPQVGLISVYALRHGPLLRAIPVGAHCHIFTAQLVVGSRSFARCCLLRHNRGHVVVSTVGLEGATEDASTDVNRQIIVRLRTENQSDAGTELSDAGLGLGSGFLDCSAGREEGELVRAFGAAARRWQRGASSGAAASTSRAADGELEATLLSIARHLHTPSALAECVDAVTAAEGEPGPLLMPSAATAVQTGAPRALFSALFHAELADLLQALCQLCDESPTSRLRQEACERKCLVDLYSCLLSISAQGGGTAATIGGDDVDSVLRQRGLRTEALVWLRRREGWATGPTDVPPLGLGLSSERGRRRPDSEGSILVTHSSPHGSRSRDSLDSSPPLGSAVPARLDSREGMLQLPSPLQLLSSMSTSHQGSRGAGSRIVHSRTSFSSQQGSGDDSDTRRRLSFDPEAPQSLSSPSPSPSTTGSSTRTAQKAQANTVPFSALRKLLADIGERNSAPIPPLGPGLGLAAARLLLCALLGDCSVFSLREYESALQQAGLGGGLGLRVLLPLLAATLAEAPAAGSGSELQSLLTRQLSSSPLRRLMRDNLLAMQDEYAELTRALNSSLGEEWTLADAQLQLEVSPLLPLLLSSRCGLGAPPSFEELVLHVLEPLWLFLRGCTALESAMTLSAVVAETLHAVGEQVERRSYGACSVAKSAAAFETLFRQLRVLLLLSSRSSRPLAADHLNPRCSVAGGSSQSCSIYQLLAEDSLRFSVLSEEAREHESRCRDVFTRSASSTSAAGGALLAWGSGADRRWPELLSAASEGPEGGESSRSAAAAEESRRSKLQRRRPLLLFFPHHNHLSALAAYRGFLLGARWAQTPRKIKLLSLVVSHLYPLPAAIRAAAAERVCTRYIFPFLCRFLVSRRDYSIDGGAEGDVAACLQDVVYLLGHPSLLRELTRGCAELMAYCQVDPAVLEEGALQQAMDPTYPWLLGQQDQTVSPHDGPEEHTECPALWPPLGDPFLSQVLRGFAARRGCSAGSIRTHICALWVMELRACCGLLGLPLSDIFYGGAEEELFAEGSLRSSACYERLATIASADASASGDIAATRSARLQFLQQCFQRSPSEHPQLAYQVGEAWAVPEDTLRLFHIETLLERGGSDGLAEQLMSRVGDRTRLVDSLTASLRTRLGSTLVVMDRIPSLLPSIAAMDAEAYTWARSSCSHPPEASVIDAIARGERPLTAYSAASTKHLVTALQGLCVAGSGGREDGWIDRRQRVEHLCDVSRKVLTASQQQRGDKAATIVSLRDEGLAARVYKEFKAYS